MCSFYINPFRLRRAWAAGPGLSEFEGDDIRSLHRSLPEYRPTPLHRLQGLAAKLGLGQVLVKDESHRFGLKAFKALGAAYAVYRFVQQRLTDAGAAADFYSREDVLPEGAFTFCTATDGNHGRGVAWVARKLRQRAVIYMPSGSSRARVKAIEGEGARVIVVDGNYDEAVRQAAADAKACGWQVISDTAWSGYEEIPRWIVAGYRTLFEEIDEALEADERPDIVIVPSGVGALAAAAAWHFRAHRADGQARLVSVEPLEAACMLESCQSTDGAPVTCRGRLDSIMAGLNCGTPSTVAWPLIKIGFDLFMTVDDATVVRAMRTCYYPAPGDPQIVAGESGAAAMAALLALRDQPELAGARGALGLGPGSTVLLLSTEGDTDPESFRRLVIAPGPSPE